MNRKTKIFLIALIVMGALGILTYSIPTLYIASIKGSEIHSPNIDEFPVTVDPTHKLITENAEVNAYLISPNSPLQASAQNGGSLLWKIFSFIAESIAQASWYESLASVNSHFVTISAGMRKEQVAAAFGTTLDWNLQQKLTFLTPKDGAQLPLTEGSFAPATYYVEGGAKPDAVQAQVNARFVQDVLSHYGTATQEKVPLHQALTIASIIQRETIGNDDMRLISGIIWNRLFVNMNLQVDATLQYAKASTNKTTVWWPKVVPNDKYLKSPYNTYSENGLPPTPIANPSVAAILAALNPIKTSCLYYFNDTEGNFHCSDTYKEHVASLKKIYGKGK